MATKKVGTLVKEARTAAGLTQEQLAKKVANTSANDISRLERGEVDFTQTQLKEIAKAVGVTQKSLLEAPKNLGKSTTAAKKTTSTSSTKKTTAKSSETKSGGRSAGKTSASSKTTSTKKSTSGSSKSTSSQTSMKVSATEKKLVERWREADSETRKVVTAILKGERPDTLAGATSAIGAAPGSMLEAILSNALKSISGK